MLKKSSFVLLLLLFTAAYGEESKPELYQVEFILFENPINDMSKVDSELTKPLLSPDYTNAIELSKEDDAGANAYELLPFSQKMLNREHWLLSKKGNYKILLHYSWLQPMDEIAKIHIKEEDEEQGTWNVEGILSLRKTNYFEFATDLNFNLPVSDKSKSFSFKQKRRLRSDETHYLDHPLIGMIIKIHPLG